MLRQLLLGLFLVLGFNSANAFASDYFRCSISKMADTYRSWGEDMNGQYPNMSTALKRVQKDPILIQRSSGKISHSYFGGDGPLVPTQVFNLNDTLYEAIGIYQVIYGRIDWPKMMLTVSGKNSLGEYPLSIDMGSTTYFGRCAL